jgi:hypothetical protein
VPRLVPSLVATHPSSLPPLAASRPGCFWAKTSRSNQRGARGNALPKEVQTPMTRPIRSRSPGSRSRSCPPSTSRLPRAFGAVSTAVELRRTAGVYSPTHAPLARFLKLQVLVWRNVS